MITERPAWSKARTWHGRMAAIELGPDVPRAQIYAAAHRLRRYQAAIDDGRIPGRNGRPITSTHPRAAYYRERARRRYTMKPTAVCSVKL